MISSTRFRLLWQYVPFHFKKVCEFMDFIDGLRFLEFYWLIEDNGVSWYMFPVVWNSVLFGLALSTMEFIARLGTQEFWIVSRSLSVSSGVLAFEFHYGVLLRLTGIPAHHRRYKCGQPHRLI